MFINFGQRFIFNSPIAYRRQFTSLLHSRKIYYKKDLMDIPTSIITQVARDGDALNNGFMKRDDKSIRGSVKSKRKGDGGQNASFRSLLCCFGKPRRKGTLTHKPMQDNWTPTNNGKSNDHSLLSPTSPNSSVVKQTPENSLPNGEKKFLLPDPHERVGGKKCAVIDLDETLVHSSFKPISNADFIVPVEIDGTVHQVYVLKRPHVDVYLERMGQMYECVLFTASLAKYADPVADLLDRQGVFSARLFRESCVFHRGNYVKDLSLIGRDLNKVIIIDNSPASYIFHPDNAVPVISWFDDPGDTELLDLLPFLEAIAESEDVYQVLQSHGFTSHAQQTTASMQQQQQENDDEER